MSQTPATPSRFENPASRKFLAGLVGRDILASRSPWIHEQEAAAQGDRMIYSLYDFTARGWEPSQLGGFLDAARMTGFCGLNVTYPFKQLVMGHLDGLTPVARLIGAVNTIQFKDNLAIGHNTDVIGFGESLRAGLPGVRLDRVVQFGAGGAGSATAYALRKAGVKELILVDKDEARRKALAGTLKAAFGPTWVREAETAAAFMSSVDGVVNTTPVGMNKHPGTPFDVGLLSDRHWVADIIYFPLETELLREAQKRGCRTMGGSGMVVLQAAAAFEIFTGSPANGERMMQCFLASYSAGFGEAA